MGAGDPHQHEEVLVDRDHPDRTTVTGEPAQRVAEGLDVGEHVVGKFLHLPHAFLAIGGEREVDLVELLGHTSRVTEPSMAVQWVPAA